MSNEIPHQAQSAEAEPTTGDVLVAIKDLSTLVHVQNGHVMTEISGVKADINDLRALVDRNHIEAMTLGRDNRNALRSLKVDVARLDSRLTAHINDPDAHRRAA